MGRPGRCKGDHITAVTVVDDSVLAALVAALTADVVVAVLAAAAAAVVDVVLADLVHDDVSCSQVELISEEDTRRRATHSLSTPSEAAAAISISGEAL